MTWMTGHLTRRSPLLSFPVFSALPSFPHFDCRVAAAASCLKHFSVLCLSRRFPPHTTLPAALVSHVSHYTKVFQNIFVFALDFSVIYVSMPSGMLACLSVSLSDLPTFTYDPTLYSLSGHLTLSRCMQRTHSSGLLSFFRNIINHKRLSSHFCEINGNQVKVAV